MIRITTIVLSFLLLLICWAPASAGPLDGIISRQTLTWIKTGGVNLMERECWQRIGPFVSQQTAWNRWRQAKIQGYSVSNGVFPCWENRVRGYCFNVYYAC